MTAPTLDRPAEANRASAGPARRAVLRWSWRMFRRQWRQQSLILAMIAVAVAATIIGAAIATNTPPSANAGFGTADHLLTLSAGPDLASDIAAIRARVGTVDVIENRSLTTGLTQNTELRAQDPHGAFGQPMLALLSGRYPNGAGEAAITRGLADSLGVHLGDLWAVNGTALRLVGYVENPQALLEQFALVAPGQLAPPARVTVLFDADESTLTGATFPQQAQAESPRPLGGFDPAIVVFAIAILGLIFVGLVATAGFSVLAQRRLRPIGVLSSLGATDRNIRLALVGNGGIVGIAGAVTGAVIGFAGWIAYVPRLETAANHRISWTDLPWWLIAAVIALAVLTAVAASWRPARTAARIPVVAALSGRPVQPRPIRRSAIPGGLTLTTGLVLLALSGGLGSDGGRSTLFQLGGLLAVAAGLLLLAPAAATLLGIHAGRAPVSMRIALRDLARYRARSGSALAAISFAVLIAMLITLIAAGRFADPVDYFGPNLAADELALYTGGNAPGDEATTNPVAAQQTPAQKQARAKSVATTLHTQNILTLDAAGNATLGQKMSDDEVRGGPGTLYVATPAVLAHYGIGPADITPTTMLITSRPGLQQTTGLQLLHTAGAQVPNPADPTAGLEATTDPKIQTFAELPTDTSAPNLLVTPYAVTKLHLQVTPAAAWLIQSPTALTAQQINAARQIAAAGGMTIETQNDAPSLTALGTDATIAGILFALGILAMTVGLIRSETAGDLRILTATGARGTTRRAITASTAGALGLTGAVLGTAVAYLAAVCYFHSQLTQRMSNPPTLDLLLILFGLPAVAAAGGWLFAGRPPPAISRQPLS